MSLNPARLSAAFFVLWGVIHIAGGGSILAALGNGPAAGYAFYANAAGDYPAAAGAILAYNSFAILWTGAIVAAVAVILSWRGNPTGAYINLALTGLSEVGLIVFLVLPGFIPWSQASIGLVPFLAATAFAVPMLHSRHKA